MTRIIGECVVCRRERKCVRMHVDTVVGPEWIVHGRLRKSDVRHAREVRIRDALTRLGLRDGLVCSNCYYHGEKT